MELLRFAYVESTPTPIYDRLVWIIGGETLATYHGQTGGEWDCLRDIPLRRRQALTGAGWMSRWGAAPDVFADLLRSYGPSDVEGLAVGMDPIEWYVREAWRATIERRYAVNRDRHRRLAKRAGKSSYYAYRDARAVEAGYESLWHYRKAMGWT